MSPSNRTPRLHLISGLMFLTSGALFVTLGFLGKPALRRINLLVGGVLMLSGLLQALAARRKRVG